jgi:ankyrin repeat protein
MEALPPRDRLAMGLRCVGIAGTLLGLPTILLLFFGLSRWQMSMYGPLQQAAHDGNISAMRSLLDSGADVNGRCEYHAMTALHAAAKAGQSEAAKILLERGAKVNTTDDQGYTPLHVATRYGKGQPATSLVGRNAVAGMLLDNGADPNVLTTNRQSALMLAAFDGNPGMVKLLLGHSADPNLVDAQGHTAMDTASFMNAAREHEREVILLLEAHHAQRGKSP